VKVVAITQARCGSTRLPNKVLKKINGKTLLEIHLHRIQKSKKIHKLIVATTINCADDAIVAICNKLNVSYYRGDEMDVLDRFYQSLLGQNVSYVVRLTADCPLIDPVLIDEVIDYTISKDLDYCSNTLVENFPDGQDIEVIKFHAFKEAWKNADKSYQREHVTPYIRENSTFAGGTRFKSDNFETVKKYGDVRMTVDEQKDFDVISLLIEKLGTEKKWIDYADFYQSDKQIQSLNSDIKRNEGYKKV
jgi:spore coat polysaccharide biosynthesis protein SpsF